MGKPTRGGGWYDYNSEVDWIGTTHQDAMWIGHTSKSSDEYKKITDNLNCVKKEDEMSEKEFSDSDIFYMSVKIGIIKMFKFFVFGAASIIKNLTYYAFLFFVITSPTLLVLKIIYNHKPFTQEDGFMMFLSGCCIELIIMAIIIYFVQESRDEAILALRQKAQAGDITMSDSKSRNGDISEVNENRTS